MFKLIVSIFSQIGSMGDLDFFPEKMGDSGDLLSGVSEKGAVSFIGVTFLLFWDFIAFGFGRELMLDGPGEMTESE